MVEGAQSLILQAFAMARRSGKSDWRRMTIAVLKNRLLALSHGSFHESKYGARSVRDFVLTAADLVRLDESTFPPTVELLVDLQTNAEETTTLSTRQPGRIRPDLWYATLDYRRGTEYVWDAKLGRARPRLEGDDLPRLPTIDESDLDAWRTEFVAKHSVDMGEEDRALLQRWKDIKGPTKFLPSIVQRSWNATLAAHVETRLRKWFDDQQIPLPANLLVTSPRALNKEPVSESHLDALRSIVIECVRSMTLDELREIKLPAAAVLRIRLTSPSED